MISEIRKKVIENGHMKIVTYDSDSEVEVHPYQNLMDVCDRFAALGFTAQELGMQEVVF